MTRQHRPLHHHHFRSDTACLFRQHTQLLKLYPSPLQLVPSSPDKPLLCLVSSKWQDVLISLGSLVSISPVHCHIFFLAHSDRLSSRKPCLHPDLSTGSELASLCAPADPNHQGQRCALVRCQDGNGDCGCQRVCCLPWLEITAQVEVGCMRYSGRWCGFDAGRQRCYSVLRHTVALYP